MERETGIEPATSSFGSEHSCDFYQLPGSKEVYAELHWSQQLNPSEGNYRLAHRNELGLQNEGSPRDVTGESIQNRTLPSTPIFFFERKRRNGFPSETRVKRGFPSGSL